MSRPRPSSYPYSITEFEERRPFAQLVRLLSVCLLVLLLFWVAVPLARAGLLLWTNPFRAAPAQPKGLAVRPVQFHAADGVLLRGWYVPFSSYTPSVVLVAGFKADRTSMVPYARFLHAAGFNVLLYDSRGTGASEGTFSMGVREVNDVRGAVSYLERRSDLRNHRLGLLGVSLGAGVAIVAAARLPAVLVTVADSAYVDQTVVVRRLDALQLGSLAVPLAPLAPWFVDHALGVPLASFSPLRAAAKIAPRGLLLIHSRHDTNPTTPLSGAMALHRAAGPSSLLWIAPHGGHAGALAAQPTEYQRRVVALFRRYLGTRP
jgi:pimeloyl-ACP methyl ester carboxylesterase